MERRLTEEQVTKAILYWLEANGWLIISYDFPQSGTGVSIHPNEELRTTKNKGAFIPDIVAFKNKTVVFFENKDRFVVDDFVKIQDLKQTNDYSTSIKKLLTGFEYTKIFYGVALAQNDNTELKTQDNLDKIDFAIFITQDKEVSVFFDTEKIFENSQ